MKRGPILSRERIHPEEIGNTLIPVEMSHPYSCKVGKIAVKTTRTINK